MYKCSLRHIHDPVLLPLKVEILFLTSFLPGYFTTWITVLLGKLIFFTNQSEVDLGIDLVSFTISRS